MRCNVEFFSKVRNKIEHRYERLFASAIAGKTQAHVLNYESDARRLVRRGAELG